MSRTRTALAVSTAAALVLAACGGEGSGSADGDVVQLSFWNEWAAEPYRAVGEDLVARFNEEHPGIEVTMRPIENESFFTTLRTAFASEEPPDVFQHEANNNLFQFVVEDQVEDITDWWEAEGNGDRFAEGTGAAVSYDGAVYGVPLNLHTATQLFYNEAVLAEAGIDVGSLETWDDFLAAFADLREQGVTPIAFGNKEGWPGSQWFYALLVREVGAEKVNQLVARNCGYAWTDDDVVEAAQLYVDLSESGYFSEGRASDDWAAASGLFFAGRAAFFHTGSWFTADAMNAPEGAEIGMVEFPPVPGGAGAETEQVAAVLGGMSMSRAAGEDPAKREAALAFIDWMSQTPQQQEWVAATGDLSVIDGAITEDSANPFVLQIQDELLSDLTGSIGFIEHNTQPTVGEEAIWQGSTAVLTGQLTAETWMESVEAAAAAAEPVVAVEESCG
jgi:raffinose/stachyose/melibiose transport system substrate-binding protein